MSWTSLPKMLASFIGISKKNNGRVHVRASAFMEDLMQNFLKMGAGLALTVSTVTTQPCDQVMYDSLYQTIITQTIIQITPQDFEERNTSIRILRKLCKGQRSTYENPDGLTATN